MKKRLNTNLGFYSPSFLRMHVGSKFSLINLNNLRDDFTESVYLHEYVHFIQDVSTVYGLSNICINVDYLKFVNGHIIKQPKGKFIVPVLAPPNDAFNIHANSELAKIYNGNGDDEEIVVIGCEKLDTTFQTHSVEKQVAVIFVEYRDNSGKVKDFEFGGLCIMESMAFIIESQCYTNCEPSPDLPYNSAVKLVEYLYPEFGENILNVLALCDASLKTYHPGLFFYDTILYIRDNSINISTPEDIYAIGDEMGLKMYGVNLEDLLVKSSILAIEQLHDYFNDPKFLSIKDWLEYMINSAVRYRMNNKFFILHIARRGKISVNASFQSFLSIVGTPLITNDANETSLYDPRNTSVKPNYATVWAIEQIYYVLLGDQKNCELIDFCKGSNLKTDHRCSIEPWQRHLEPTCAFGQMWRHWALSGYQPA